MDYVDINKDQRLDINEFRNLINRNLGAGASASIYGGNALAGGQYGASAYEASSSGAYGDITGAGGGYAGDLAATNLSGIGNEGSNASYSSYEQASYTSATGGTGGFEANIASAGNVAGSTAAASASSSTFEAASAQQQVQQYATNAQGLYQDPNPQIVRRPAQGGQLTYTQNIKIRFLQPPAVPPPGVSLILM